MGGGHGYVISPLAMELLVLDGCWDGESKGVCFCFLFLFLFMIQPLVGWPDRRPGPKPMSNWAVQTAFNGERKKKKK